MSKRVRGRPPRPILQLGCDLSLAKGLYVADGTSVCSPELKKMEATFRVEIAMRDREALQRIQPCFGAGVSGPRPDGRFVLAKAGRPGLELANKLAITPDTEEQVKRAVAAYKRLVEERNLSTAIDEG